MEPTTATAVTEGAKATRKFMDVLQSFFKPRITKKQADADIYAINKMKEAEKEYPDLDFAYQDGRIIARKFTNGELLERSKQRKLIESLRQEQNLEQVMALAVNEVKNTNENVSNEPVDEDWLMRFFHIAEDVSSEDMQLIWSKILAGEIIHPGRFSLRTLETIRNVSKSEAEIFQKILPVTVKFLNNVFITANKDILEKNNITYEMILRLGECGLVNPNSLLSMDFTVTNRRDIQILNNKKLIKILGKDEAPLQLSHQIYPLTKVGEELYAILTYPDNDEYIFDLAQKIYESYKNKITISIHNIVGCTGDGRSIYIEQPLHLFS